MQLDHEIKSKWKAEKQIIHKMVKKDTPTSNPTYLNKKQARQEKVKQKKKNSILRFGNFNIYI